MIIRLKVSRVVLWGGLCWAGYALVAPTPVRGEEATGAVLECTQGAFKMNADGTVRFFKLSMRATQYEPETWRPTKGDQVTVDFRVHDTELVVQRAKLVAPGPDTISDLDNPVAVEVVQDVRSFPNKYLDAKIASGHTVRFATGGTRWEPVGWLPAPGEKAVVEYRAKRQMFGFGVDLVALKVTKVD